MRGGRVREGDLCAIKIVKALGSCGGGVDTEEGSSHKTEHTSQRKKSQHSIEHLHTKKALILKVCS